MTRPSLRRGQGPASYYVTASLLWPAGIIAVTAFLAAGDLRAVLRAGARWCLTRHRRLDIPGCYEIYDSKEAAMMTHTTVQAMGRPGWATCTTKPGAMRWSAPLTGPAAPSGIGPGQCARARQSAAKTSIGRSRKAIRDG
jgi:hypothetical protein